MKEDEEKSSKEKEIMDAKRVVLVINTELLNRKLFNEILKEEYTVLTAKNRVEALDLLKKYDRRIQISAVFLDTDLFVNHRYQSLEMIRDENSFSNIPVIITIREGGEQAGIEALKCGASDFILPPYHPEIVRLRLKNLIQAEEAKSAFDLLEMDTLTGLLTKEAFYRKVECILRSGESGYCVVAADLERFIVFNDAYGEVEGDNLLKRIAKEFRKAFDKKTLIAHGYADRFFLFTKKEKELEEKFLKISMQVQNFFPSTRVVVKFGIYDIDEKEYIVRAMCDRATLAIGIIKNQYDKVFCYYNDAIRENLIMEQKITSIMNWALEQHQFQVYYQPKFDAEAESIVGAEALVRWIHPEYGFLTPSKFIPVFEKNGFITEMDKYVWEEVCIFLKKQKENARKLIPISVNVSRKDIYNEDLSDYFPKLIEKYGLESKWLHLEVTESAYSENPQQVVKVISQLRKKGFIIEMDDFGSGYSSLNALSEIPIDVLKLDMKFIQNEFLHKNSKNIIHSVINLAKWMNLLIVAEGVESKEQLENLRELKCNIIQGYYFAKPMQERELERMLEEWEVQPVYDVDSYIRNSVREKEKQVETNLMLVVDDLTLNRVILREYFEGEYNIKECDNGTAAWEFIQKHYKKILIIMLDLYMPGMDGFELLKRLKKSELYKQIPVIITSQAGKELEQRMPEIQIEGLLPKPYLKEEAKQLVTNALVNQIRIDRRKKTTARQRFFEVKETSLDKLTRVLNSNAFEQEARKFLQGQEKAVLVFLKVDHLTEVIGEMEDITEDGLLITVAELLKRNVRNYDLIGRMEEDQFALLLKASISQDRLINRIGGLQNCLKFYIQDTPISCTFGVCPCMEEDHDYEMLYENARRAYLVAKAEGGESYRII